MFCHFQIIQLFKQQQNNVNYSCLRKSQTLYLPCMWFFFSEPNINGDRSTGFLNQPWKLALILLSSMIVTIAVGVSVVYSILKFGNYNSLK